MAALRAGARKVYASDKYDWGFKGTTGRMLVYNGIDFLGKYDKHIHGVLEDATAFINPAFSVACEFVDKAMECRARKIVCFQRSVWRESEDRREWWEQHPPNRIYQCGNRAICWYGTIPLENRKGGAYQPHSWYVWERDQPVGTLQGTIWKDSK